MALQAAAENIQKNQPDAGMSTVVTEAIGGLESAGKIDHAARLLGNFVDSYTRQTDAARATDITIAAETRRTQAQNVSEHNLKVNIINHIDPKGAMGVPGVISDRATLEQSINNAGPDIIGKDRKVEAAIAGLREKLQKEYANIMILDGFDPAGTGTQLTNPERVLYMRAELQPYVDKGFMTQAEAETIIKESAEAVSKKASDIAMVFETGLLSEADALNQAAAYAPDVVNKLKGKMKEIIAKKPKMIERIEEAKRNMLLSQRTAGPLDPSNPAQLSIIYPNFSTLSPLEQDVLQNELNKEYIKYREVRGQASNFADTLSGGPSAKTSLAEAMTEDLKGLKFPKGPIGDALREAVNQFNNQETARTNTENAEARAKMTEMGKERKRTTILRLKHYGKWAAPAAILVGGAFGISGYNALTVGTIGTAMAAAEVYGLSQLNRRGYLRSLELDQQLVKDAKINEQIQAIGMDRASRMLEAGMNARDIMTILISEGSSLKLDDVKNYLNDLTGFKEGLRPILNILRPTNQTRYASVA